MQLRWHEKASPAQVAAIAAEIDSAGFCRIDNFVSPEELRSLASLAEDAVVRAGGEYAAFTSAEGDAGAVWEKLKSSPTLQFLCDKLYSHSTGMPATHSEFHPVFRCLKGKFSKKHSLYFHFDSYAVTLLIPIIIPDSTQSGNLILFPSMRPIRKTYWRNVVDKIFSDSPPMQLYYRFRARSPRSRTLSVKLQPGSAVAFWGYRSLHTNDHCDADKLRATALLHFGNPHRPRGL